MHSLLIRAESYLRTAAACGWVLISTPLYGLIVIAIARKSPRFSRSIGLHWLRTILLLGGAKVRVKNPERIDRTMNYVIVSNHISLLDIPALMTSLPLPLFFVAKQELFKVPVFGPAIKALGHIELDRTRASSAREAFRAAGERIRNEKVSIVIFPEGTRSPDGQLAPFKRASFNLVIESKIPAIPVAIAGSNTILRKNSLLFHPGKITIALGESVPMDQVSLKDKEMIAEKFRSAILALSEDIDSDQ